MDARIVLSMVVNAAKPIERNIRDKNSWYSIRDWMYIDKDIAIARCPMTVTAR